MDITLPRKSQDATAGSHYRSAAGLASVLTSAFHSMLAEADSYSALFEARIKHEENFIHALRSAIEKQNEIDVKAESKSPSAYTALFANGSATLRMTWRELRDNQSREIEMRQTFIDNLRFRVVAPLQTFRDSQERIRRRVKEDLKVSLADYDQMRDHTLPRLRRTYEKKCEQLEQLRGQQQAIDDQRALLSPPSSSQQVPTLSPLRETTGQSDGTQTNDEELLPPAAAPGMQASTSQQSAPEHRAYPSGGPTYDVSGPSQFTNRSDINLSTSPSSPPSGSEKTKVSLREALRTKEGREAAIKDAPKKLQGFINRMREGAAEKASGSRDRDASDYGTLGGSSGAAAGAGAGTGGSGGLGASLESATVGLVRGASAAKSIQNIALRSIQVKKESEDADRAYRKAVFDLETLRIRRAKTLSAAVTSVVECRRDLNRTAQLAFLDAERAALHTAHAAVSVHDRTEQIVEGSEAAMANEVTELESGLAAVMQDDEGTVPYFNYWHGQARVIFGISLTDYAFSHQRGRVVQPPTIVVKCITYIEKHGLEQQGIYRISARHSAIQALLAAVEKDEEGIDFEVLKPELSTVAGLLKLYLRELPEPVMAMPWEERIRHTHDREEHIRTGFAQLKGRIRRLPPINNVTLKAIIFHLANVAAHADKNSMTESNLAVIFGPVLLTEADHETTSLAAAMEEDRVVEDLIRHAPQLFEAGPLDPAAAAGMTSTATMAQGISLVTSDSDAAPSIAIPAVPLSSSLKNLASASSSSDVPLLPGSTGLKRSNAITPGEAVSPPRRDAALHPHVDTVWNEQGAPTLPPVQASPLGALNLDNMGGLSPEAIKWAEEGDSTAETKLVSRSSTVRRASGGAQQPGESVAEVASPIDESAAAMAWADARFATSSSTSSSGFAVSLWADRIRAASGDSGPAPSSGSTSSGFSIPRPLPQPSGQQTQPAHAALPPSGLTSLADPSSSSLDKGTDRATAAGRQSSTDSEPAAYPPPVSELIFTRPPPTTPTLSAGSPTPPARPATIKLNTPVPTPRPAEPVPGLATQGESRGDVTDTANGPKIKSGPPLPPRPTGIGANFAEE
ncbi:hypothetical protein V8E36_000357 [Tilletia maclaganii]